MFLQWRDREKETTPSLVEMLTYEGLRNKQRLSRMVGNFFIFLKNAVCDLYWFIYIFSDIRDAKNV